jgi:ribosomal-protein-serine acetyltransferase
LENFIKYLRFSAGETSSFHFATERENGLRSGMDKSFPTYISGERIFIKKHEIELAPTAFALVDANRGYLREFLPWVDATLSVADSWGWIEITHRQWETGQIFDFGIYLEKEAKYIGNIGVHTIDWTNRCCEIGFWVGSEFQGHGLVSEAVQILEKVIFEKGFNRIEIHCSQKNIRSAAVAKRNGYLLEGILRQKIKENTKYSDLKVFSKLKSDRKK